MVRKAVLPAAGLGTRFLPVTKAVPKEMLPILDRPCIEYVVVEAIEAGITDIVLVTSRGKSAMEDYFDRSPALEATLEAAGKTALLAEVRRVARLATVVTVRQQEQRGLGHAVLAAGVINGCGSLGPIVQELVIGRMYDTSGGDLGPILGLLVGSAVMSLAFMGVLLLRNRAGKADL